MNIEQSTPTDRRTLLAGLGGLAAGTFLTASRAEAGSLTPPGAPAPTGKTLTEVEPRIAINAANTPGNVANLFIINKPGSYYLTGNITGENGKNGILIMSSNVTIDLMGFAMLGVAGSLRGIATSGVCEDLIIRNGTIRGWGSDGINLTVGGPGFNALVEGIIAAANTRIGIRVGNVAVVRGCLAEDNGEWGIACNVDSVIVDCVVRSNTGRGLSTASGGTVVNCSAHATKGNGIVVGAGCRVTNCLVRGSTDSGISVGGQCLVEGNHVSDSQAGGIHVTGGSDTVVQDNTVRSTGNFGLKAETGGHTFRNNSVRGCTENYVFAAGNNLELLISQIPQTLSWSCVARLEGTLQGVANQNGINVMADDVTIDLMGFALVGVLDSWSGIDSSGNNVTVRNGTIRNWGSRGFTRVGSLSNGRDIIEGVKAISNGLDGMIVGYGSLIRGCLAEGNNASGIHSMSDCTISNCTAYHNAGRGINAGGRCNETSDQPRLSIAV